MSIQKELKQLRSEMEGSIDGDLFFFPRKWGVDGYFGTGAVCFVAQKPSTGSFPSRHDRLLYGSMITNSLENAHLTDFSKETGQGGEEIAPQERQRNLPYFERELNILQPELLVALGEKAKNELEWMDATDDIETMRVNHYSWAYGDEQKGTFLAQMNGVKQRAQELNLV